MFGGYGTNEFIIGFVNDLYMYLQVTLKYAGIDEIEWNNVWNVFINKHACEITKMVNVNNRLGIINEYNEKLFYHTFRYVILVHQHKLKI